MIFERSTREQALEDIRAALREEKLYESDAEALAAIASDYDIAIEWVCQFIHTEEPLASNVVSEFARFAAGYRKFADEARSKQQADLFPHAPEAFD